MKCRYRLCKPLCCARWKILQFIHYFFSVLLGYSAWNIQYFAWRSSKTSLILNTKPTKWKVSRLKALVIFACSDNIIWGWVMKWHESQLHVLFSLVCLIWKLWSHCGNSYAAVVDEAVKKEQVKIFQLLINRLNDCRKVWSYCYS